MKIDELRIRNSSKKNAVRSSKQAEQYDFLVKKGIKQDDIEFMSIFDTPMPVEGMNISLGEYINEIQVKQDTIQRKLDKLTTHYVNLYDKYQKTEENYKELLKKGVSEYIKVLANL